MLFKPAKYILLAALIAGLLSSCFYSDSEIWVVNPVAGDPAIPHLNCTLDSVSLPAEIEDSLRVYFDIEIGNGSFYWGTIHLNEQELYSAADSIGSVLLDSTLQYQGDGADELIFELYFSSNTNSLGDYFEVEAADSIFIYPVELSQITEEAQ